MLIRKIFKNYYCSGLYDNTKKFVLSRTLCIQHKPYKTPPAPLKEMFITNKPNYIFSIDFLGPFSNGFHVLTFLDYFSKHMDLYPVKSNNMQAVVNAFTVYVTSFGRSAVLLSDIDTQFTSNIINNFLTF